MYQPVSYDLPWLCSKQIKEHTNEKIISLLFTQYFAVFQALGVKLLDQEIHYLQ